MNYLQDNLVPLVAQDKNLQRYGTAKARQEKNSLRGLQLTRQKAQLHNIMVITPEGAKYRKANQVIAKKIEKKIQK
jgi:hypothetical protein